jgi:hypothetical protein
VIHGAVSILNLEQFSCLFSMHRPRNDACALASIRLYDNELTGTIPVEITGMMQLSKIFFAYYLLFTSADS